MWIVVRIQFRCKWLHILLGVAPGIDSGNTNEGARSKEMTNEKRNCIVEYIYGFG